VPKAETHELLQHLQTVVESLQVISLEYTLLFNDCSVPSVADKNVIEPDSKHLKPYLQPCSRQVGYLVDCQVGHIDHFKFFEEFQLDYHMKAGGFHRKQELI